jgi:hypothetical protein
LLQGQIRGIRQHLAKKLKALDFGTLIWPTSEL